MDKKGEQGEGRQLTSRDHYAHTPLSGVASIPPSVRFPSGSVRLVLRPHRQRRFDARPDFVVIVKSGPFDLRPTLAFPSHCADQTRISARLGT